MITHRRKTQHEKIEIPLIVPSDSNERLVWHQAYARICTRADSNQHSNVQKAIRLTPRPPTSDRVCVHRTSDIDLESTEIPSLLADWRLAEKSLAQDRQSAAHGLLVLWAAEP